VSNHVPAAGVRVLIGTQNTAGVVHPNGVGHPTPQAWRGPQPCRVVSMGSLRSRYLSRHSQKDDYPRAPPLKVPAPV
jgi:hypothetical protein